ncbi:MAG: GDP-mannose 4,6-dehydratase [Gammaproteobacteria bacterium]
MRVLVTGLEGFTGKYIREELEAHGHTVVGLTSDLMQAPAVDDEVAGILPEAVIHLAGISFVQNEDINQIYQVNLLGTRNLLESLFKHVTELKCVILASTGNVYGNSTEGMLSEDSPLHPANDYSVSKLAMEYMSALWSDKLPICIVRPFNYTGVGQSDRFLIPKIVSHFKMKAPMIELGNLDVSREFGDVRRVAEVYRKLVEKEHVAGVVNICTGKAYSLKRVIGMCESLTGHSIGVNVNPLFVRQNEVRTLVGDSSKLTRIIGTCTEFDFEETLRWMLSS